MGIENVQEPVTASFSTIFGQEFHWLTVHKVDPEERDTKKRRNGETKEILWMEQRRNKAVFMENN